MYILGSLVAEVLKVLASMGVMAFVATPRDRKGSEPDRRAARDLLVELLKVVVSVGIGAFLGAWREGKRNQQIRQELAQLRQDIRQDVHQTLTQWGAQGQVSVATDDGADEPLAVSGRAGS